MKHVIEHGLDEATARKVTEHAFAEYKAKYPSYDPTLSWTSDRAAKFRARRRGRCGKRYERIQVSVTIGYAAGPAGSGT